MTVLGMPYLDWPRARQNDFKSSRPHEKNMISGANGALSLVTGGLSSSLSGGARDLGRGGSVVLLWPSAPAVWTDLAFGMAGLSVAGRAPGGALRGTGGDDDDDDDAAATEVVLGGGTPPAPVFALTRLSSPGPSPQRRMWENNLDLNRVSCYEMA